MYVEMLIFTLYFEKKKNIYIYRENRVYNNKK